MSARGTARKPSGSRRPGTRRAAPAPLRHTPDTARARSARRPLLLGAGLVLALAVLAATWAVLAGGGRSDEVASLDGRPVTRAELLFHMKRLAPTVQNELSTKYHLKEASFSWNDEAGGRTALQRLETRAFAEIRTDRTTLVLARQQGLTDSVDLAGLDADRTEENASRARAIAAGQTVYGVTDFSLEEYYTHRLTELTTGLESSLSKKSGDPLHVTDAQVRTAFDADPDSWSADATTYHYTQLVAQVPDRSATAFTADLGRRVKAAGDLADVSGAQGTTTTTATYGGGDSTGVSTHDQDLMSVLGKLAPGQISAPVKGTGEITYYQLDSRKTDSGKAFSTYKQRIRQSLVAKKFATYLQLRADEASLDIDAPAVAAINAKDVQQ